MLKVDQEVRQSRAEGCVVRGLERGPDVLHALPQPVQVRRLTRRAIRDDPVVALERGGQVCHFGRVRTLGNSFGFLSLDEGGKGYVEDTSDLLQHREPVKLPIPVADLACPTEGTPHAVSKDVPGQSPPSPPVLDAPGDLLTAFVVLLVHGLVPACAWLLSRPQAKATTERPYRGRQTVPPDVNRDSTVCGSGRDLPKTRVALRLTLCPYTWLQTIKILL